MKVAVIGGGWAGLSAAVYLNRSGHQVSVFEASRTLGGRARTVFSPRLHTRIDNGQHILLGAYHETLQLLSDLGLAPATRLRRYKLSLQAANNEFALRASNLPGPLHLLSAIICARGLSPKERFRLIAIHRQLQQQLWNTAPGQTVAQWLALGKQSHHIIRYLWRPLCLAALNTPVEQACAQLFAHVLRDSLGHVPASSDILIPSVDLSDVWPEHLPREIQIRRGCAVRHLASGYQHIDVDHEPFDAAVIATNAPSARRLLADLPQSPAGDSYLAMLAAFRYLPIATLTLRLEQDWSLPHPMLLLADNPHTLQFGQWLFNRNRYMNADAGPVAGSSTLAVVISDARALQAHTHADIVTGVITQIKEQTKRFPAMPAVLGYELIIEKRATFAAVPGLKRPRTETPWPRIWTAGDWTDTGYPAVLEGAVRSGKHAALRIAHYGNGQDGKP